MDAGLANVTDMAVNTRDTLDDKARIQHVHAIFGTEMTVGDGEGRKLPEMAVGTGNGERRRGEDVERTTRTKMALPPPPVVTDNGARRRRWRRGRSTEYADEYDGGGRRWRWGRIWN